MSNVDLSDDEMIKELHDYFVNVGGIPSDEYNDLRATYDLLILQNEPTQEQTNKAKENNDMLMLLYHSWYYRDVNDQSNKYIETLEYMATNGDLIDKGYAYDSLGDYYIKVKDIILGKKYLIMAAKCDNVFAICRLIYDYYPLYEPYPDYEELIDLREHLKKCDDDRVDPQLYLIDLNKLLNQAKRKPTKAESNDQDLVVCLICHENRRNILIRPCHHMIACSLCIENITKGNNQCPICRTDISETIPIIYS